MARGREPNRRDEVSPARLRKCTKGNVHARRNSSESAVVWPRSAAAIALKPLAKRLDTLDGKTVAFLWNDLFRGDEIWPILKHELSRRRTGLTFVDHDAFGSTHGDAEHRVLAELPAKLSSLKIDAVISGMGC